MRSWLNERMDTAIKDRFPRVIEGHIGQRQLFVLPSLTGVLWSMLALVVWLTGINYQNGLVLLVAYLMASIWLAAMWLCYRNLHNIHYSIAKIRHGDTGSQAEVEIEISSDRSRYDVAVRCTTGEWRYCDVTRESSGKLRVIVDLPNRGIHQLPPLRIETRQPFDLAVVWSRLSLDCEILAFPVAKQGERSIGSDQEADGQLFKPAIGGDVDGLKAWQEGTDTQRMRWDHFLITGEKRVMAFAQPIGKQASTLSIDHYRHLGTERALQALVHEAMELNEADQPYALDLGTTLLEANIGAQHLMRVKEALARYGY